MRPQLTKDLRMLIDHLINYLRIILNEFAHIHEDILNCLNCLGPLLPMQNLRILKLTRDLKQLIEQLPALLGVEDLL